jgi:hypothetical protein
MPGVWHAAADVEDCRSGAGSDRPGCESDGRSRTGGGRNQPCPCGSGHKTKRCCGQRYGPAAAQIACAHLAHLARQAVPDLAGLSDSALDVLVDFSLLVTLPRLIDPAFRRLCESIERDDPDWGWDALTAVAEQIDTPRQRADLADALVRLRDQHRVSRRQAAYALLDLDTRSTRFIGASVLEAVAVSVGVRRTPGGLHIAA